MICVAAVVGIFAALSVVPGDSRHYDAPPGNAGVFIAGMALAAPKLVFDAVTGLCSSAPEQCNRAAGQTASDVAQPVLDLSQRIINKAAEVSTVNPDSDEVVLGLYRNGQGYTAMAEARGATYLNMPDYLWKAFKDFPGDFWKVNQQFLQTAIDKGKVFTLETPFDEALRDNTTNLYKEIQYLLAHGYEYVNENGQDMLIPKTP